VPPVIAEYKRDDGTMLPLMVAAGLFAAVFALGSVDAAMVYSFQQQLQFEADQYALTLAMLEVESSADLIAKTHVANRESYNAFDYSVQGTDARVNLCAVWQAPIKLIGLPAQSTVCVKSTAR
jgi:hypothetical protein